MCSPSKPLRFRSAKGSSWRYFARISSFSRFARVPSSASSQRSANRFSRASPFSVLALHSTWSSPTRSRRHVPVGGSAGSMPNTRAEAGLASGLEAGQGDARSAVLAAGLHNSCPPDRPGKPRSSTSKAVNVAGRARRRCTKSSMCSASFSVSSMVLPATSVKCHQVLTSGGRTKSLGGLAGGHRIQRASVHRPLHTRVEGPWPAFSTGKQRHLPAECACKKASSRSRWQW